MSNGIKKTGSFESVFILCTIGVRPQWYSFLLLCCESLSYVNGASN